MRIKRINNSTKMVHIFGLKGRETQVLLLEVIAFTSSMGTTVFGIDIGIGSISLFRLFLLFEIFMYLASKINGPYPSSFTKKGARLIALLGLWLLYVFFSLLWARDVTGYFRTLFFILIGFTLIFIMMDICNKQDIEMIMIAFNVGLLLQATIGTYEYLTGKYMYISQSTLDFYISRGYRYPIAMMFNPNDFSTAMYFASMISLYFIFSKDISMLMKITNGCMFVLYSFLIIMGGSRAVLFGLCLSIFSIFYLKRKTAGRLMIILGLILISPWIVQWSTMHIDLSYYQTQGESFSIRSNLIRNGVVFLLKTGGMGVGNGQIEYWMRNYAIYPVKTVENMHNFWAEMLTQYGIIVFLGLLIVYVNMICHFYHQYKKNNGQDGIKSLVIAGALIGYIISSISSSSNLSKEYVWFFFAICFVLLNEMGRNLNQDSDYLEFLI